MKYCYFLFVFASFITKPIMASELSPPSTMTLLETSCQDEIKKLCPKIEKGKALLKCLKQEENKISLRCKEDMSRAYLANQEFKGRSGGLNSLGGFNLTPSTSTNITYTGRMIPNNSSPSMSENKINFQVPLYIRESHSLSLLTQASILHLNQDLRLSTGTIIPKDYYRTELGSNYMQILPEKRSFGIRGSIGYNTNKPFIDSRDLSYSLSTSYSFPSSAQSTWVILLNLTNNGPFGNYIPIPGFIYFYRTSTFTGMFGFPFTSLQWTPSIPWTYSFSIFGLNINSEVAYGSIEHIQYLSGFSWNRQSYMLHNRVDEKDRLTFEEKKLFIGIRSPIFNILSSEFQMGDLFGRSVYVGNKLSHKDGGEAKIDSGLYASWTVKMIF